MDIVEAGRKVLKIEARAIESAIQKINQEFEKAVNILFDTRGRIVITGMGKSGIIGRKISATLTSTGSPAVFLHPSEALHGDIGIIHPDDVVVALSTSGETFEVIRLINYIKRIGVKLISLVGSPASTLALQSDVFIDCSIEKEACPIGFVPTTSTTLTLAIGDAISIALMEKKGFNEDDFRNIHPGGSIGKKLLKVKHLMHTDHEIPIVKEDLKMDGVIKTIDEKHFGVALVIDVNNQLSGIITDGDLRRLILKGVDFSKTTAREFMSENPLHIEENQLAVEALKILEDHRITSLAVVDKQQNLKGLLHLHDLWRTEMI